MIELVVAVAVFLVVSGVLTLVVARTVATNNAATVRRAVNAQLTEAISDIAAGGYARLIADDFDVPSPCDDTPDATLEIGGSGVDSCLTVGVRAIRVDWTVTAGGTSGDGTGTDFVLITALADVGDGSVLRQSRRVSAPAPNHRPGTGTLRLSLDGDAGYTGPVTVVSADDPADVVASSSASGDRALVHVPAGSCTTTDPCLVGLGAGDRVAVNDGWAITRAGIAAPGAAFSIGDGDVVDRHLNLFRAGSVRVDLVAENPAGDRAAADVAGSVCLWGTFDDSVGTVSVPICNTGTADHATLATYRVDPGAGTVAAAGGGIRLAVPPATPVRLSVDRPDGTCPRVAGAVGHYDTSPARDGSGFAWTDVSTCTSWTWGVPATLDTDPAGAGAPVPFTNATVEIPTGDTDRVEVTWSGTHARPAANDAAGPLWSKPRDARVCATTASCRSTADEQPPEARSCPDTFCRSGGANAAPTITAPTATNGVRAVVAPAGTTTTFTLATTDVDADPDDSYTVTISTPPATGTLTAAGTPVTGPDHVVATGAGAGAATSTELTYTPDAAGTPAWFAVTVADTETNGSRTQLVSLVGAATDPAWLGPRGPVTVAQGDTADLAVVARDATGNPAAGTPITLSGLPAGTTTGSATVTTGADGTATFPVAVDATAAGPHPLTATLDVLARPATASLTVTPTAGTLALTTAAPAVAQGGTVDATATATDRAGTPMAGVVVNAGVDTAYLDTLVTLGTGVSGHWRLGETSGTTAADETGSADGTYTDTAILGVAGATGDHDTAIAAPDGDLSPLFSASTGDLTGARTVSVWLRPGDDAPGKVAAAIRKGQGADAALEILHAGTAADAPGTLTVRAGTGTESLTLVETAEPLSSGDWHQVTVAATADGHVTVTVDGVVAGEATVPGGLRASADPLTVAGAAGTAFDELVVFAGALSDPAGALLWRNSRADGALGHLYPEYTGCVTDTTGTCTTTILADAETRAGDYTLTASSGTFSATAPLTVTAVAHDIAGDAVRVAQGDVWEGAATVLDGAGDPMPGATVTVAGPAGTVGAEPGPYTSGADGTYTYTGTVALATPQGHHPLTHTPAGWAGTGPGGTTTVTVGATATGVEQLSSSTVGQGSHGSFVVRALDGTGTAGAGGVELTAAPSADAVDAGIRATRTVTTRRDAPVGHATIQVTAAPGTPAGTYPVLVTAPDGPALQLDVTVVRRAASLTVTGTVTEGGTATFTGTVRDGNGDAMPDTALTVTDPGPFAITPSSTTTGPDGQASFTVHAPEGTGPGTYTIDVAVAGTPLAAVLVVDATPAGLAAGDDVAVAQGTSAVTTVTVTDADGNPASYVRPTVDAPAGLTATAGHSSATGIAYVSVTAADTVPLGSYVVTVTAGGATDTFTVTVDAGYPALVARDTPVAHWRLGESSGTAAADTTGTHPGAYVNAPVLGVPGAVAGDPDTAITGPGAALTTVLSVPHAPDLDVTDTFTVEAWIQVSADTPAAVDATLGKGPGGPGSSFELVVTGTDGGTGEPGRIEVWGTPAGGTWTNLTGPTGPVLADGAWHHVAFTYAAAGDAAVWVDGTLAAAASAPGPLTSVPDPFRISLTAPAAADEVALYRHLLGPDVLADHAGR